MRSNQLLNFFQNECRNRCGFTGVPWGGKNGIAGVWNLSERGTGAGRELDSDPLLGPVAEPSPLEAAWSMWSPLVWRKTIFSLCFFFSKMLLLSFNAFRAVWVAPMVMFPPSFRCEGQIQGKCGWFPVAAVVGERGRVLVGQTGALSSSFLSFGEKRTSSSGFICLWVCTLAVGGSLMRWWQRKRSWGRFEV